MMRWLLIGGTTEAREAFDYLKKHQTWILVSSATALGTEMFKDDDCEIHEGRLDRAGFEKLMASYEITHVLDASHPYAVEVTKTVKAAARGLGLPYYRYTRAAAMAEAPDTQADQRITWCEDAQSAAAYLNGQQGNVVLFTGVNTLGTYAAGIRAFKTRVYARVLDTESSRRACEALWEDEAHYLCAKPPFSTEDNLRFLKETKAAFMVTKDAGAAGGMPEKMAAAAAAGCACVIIRRPEDTEQMSGLDELEVLFQ